MMKILLSISLLLMLHLLQPCVLFGDEGRTQPRERVYLATDRDYYVAGEKLFFQLWLTGDSGGGPQSRYAYLALRQNGQVVERLTLRIRDGLTSGSLFLEDTLSTGIYEVMAYTNWMRNHGEPSFFRSEIFIANRFDRELTAIEPPVAPDEEAVLHFAAEGGRMLAGHKNRVMAWSDGAFDASNRPVVLINNKEDTLLTTRMNHRGVASFHFHPQAGNNYYLLMDGSPRHHPLPPVEEEGLSLLVEETENGVRIHLHSASPGPRAGTLAVQRGHETPWRHPFQTDSLGRATLKIDDKDLGHGMLVFEASHGETGVPARRYWYAGLPGGPVMGLDLRESFDQRDRVDLALTLPGQATGEWQLSASVRQLSSLRDDRPTAVTSLRNMLLEEELRLQSCQVEALFGHMDDKALNEFLIGYPLMSPPDALAANNAQGNGLFMETEGLVVSGRLHHPSGEQSLGDVRMLLNTPDTLINVLYTYTDEHGEFHFLLSDYYRNKELFFSVDPESYDGPYRISLRDKFDIHMPARHLSHREHWGRRSFINKSQDVVSVQIGFRTDWTSDAFTRFHRTARPPMIYNRASITVRTDNFLPLDDLREIARELVPVWRIRGSEESPQATLVCKNSGNQIPGSPVFFVDGIITHDLEKLLYMGTQEVHKVEVHNVNWVHGDMQFPGIVGLFTRGGEYQRVLAESRTHTSLFHESYRHHRRFSPPEYSLDNSINPESPDMRQLLFWSPELFLEGAAEEVITFYTGDITGKFLVTVEGFCPDGAPVHSSQVIEVKSR